MIDEKDKNKILHVIQSVLPDVKVYLFGSQATGKARQSSDIDIAVERDTPISRFELAEIKNMLENSRLLKKIDIVDINDINEDFKKEILKTRVIWKD